MESVSWIFDGLGTEIFSLIVGLISGGAIGYKIGFTTELSNLKKQETILVKHKFLQ